MYRAWQAFSFMLLAILFGACVSTGTWIPQSVERALQDNTDQTIPVFFDDGIALVPVTIGEHGPFMFVLDTGASMTVIAPVIRDRLGYTESHGRTVRITGATGRQRFQAVDLDSLEVAGHTVPDLEVVVADVEQFQRSSIRYAGILGHDFLEHFDMKYDLRKGQLELYPHYGGSVSPIAGLDTLTRIPFHGSHDDGFVTIELAVGEGLAEGIFDTGSRNSVLNWRAASYDGVIRDGGRASAETIGIAGHDAEATHRYTFQTIRADTVRFTPAEVSVADLPVFEVLQLSHPAAVLIGNNMVKDRLVVVAYSTRDVYFSGPLSD